MEFVAMNTRDEVRKLLEAGTPQNKIAEQLHISEARVSQIKQALNLPLKSPINLRGSPPTAPTDSKKMPKPSYSLRCHKHTFFFKLRTPLSPNAPPQIAMSSRLAYRPITGMRGHTDASLLDYSPPARLYPNGLLVYVEEVELPPTATMSELLAQSYERAGAIAADFEARSGQPIKRLTKDAFLATVEQQHIALRGTPISEWFREHGATLLIPDPDGGEPLLFIDFSHGNGEDETANVQKGEFVIQRVKDLLDATANGKFDYGKDQAMLHEVIGRMAYFMAAFEKHEAGYVSFEHQMASFTALLTQFGELMKEREERKPRGLRGWILRRLL
jgi:hypothetical protein